MTKRMASTALLLLLPLGVFLPGLARGDEPIRNWWRLSGRDPNWGKPCEITKTEPSPGDTVREVRCKDGVDAKWRGNFKDEFRDGQCLVKLQATRDVFKEEVRCGTH